MLKRLYIDNFRCFVNFEYKPERTQLLLGANGSGKSSLLDAIRAIQGFVCVDGGDAFSTIAFRDSGTRWLNLPKQVFEIGAEIGGRQYVYRLEMNAKADYFDRVSAESLKVDGQFVLERLDHQVRLYSANSSEAPLELGTDGASSMLGILRGFRVETRAFVEWLQDGVKCLRINPNAMKSVPQLTGYMHPQFELDDIADWYLKQTGNDIEGVLKLRTSLREVFGGAASLNFGPAKLRGVDELNLSLSANGKSEIYSLTELSHGQRCLIALYMILHFLIEKGCTVFLDEPDNYIALREIQPWLLAAEAAVHDSKGQLILISHHPEILNQWAQENGLRFFREDNGHVRTEKFRTDPDGLLQPSELIAQGWEND